jgi:ribosomal protein L2
MLSWLVVMVFTLFCASTGERRLIHGACMATVVLCPVEFQAPTWVKPAVTAGGNRPKFVVFAMNDRSHGGGEEGRRTSGGRHLSDTMEP